MTAFLPWSGFPVLLLLLVAPVEAQAPAGTVAPTPSTAAVGPSGTPGFESGLGLLWLAHSAEADALRRQTFRAARGALDEALSDPAWTAVLEQADDADLPTRPPAILVDVDETVLDNAPFQAELVMEGARFTPEKWNAWVERRAATPVPGALPFLVYAASRGVTVFYITNRDVSLEDATRDNLRRLGFPIREGPGDDVVLTRGEVGGGSDKSVRRAAAAADHRVVMVFGDDLRDFVSGVDEGSAATPAAVLTNRQARVADFADWWGTRWFVLPNPLYGSWLDRLRASAPSPDGLAWGRLLQAPK